MSSLFVDVGFEKAQLFNRAARFIQRNDSEYEAHLELPGQLGLAAFTLKCENLAPIGLRAYNQWSLRIKILGNTGPLQWPFKWLRLCGFKIHPHTESALANGYQCWSESPLLGRTDTLYPESYPEREVFSDASFYRYAQKPGVFHSWSFTYTTLEGSQKNAFYGALDEDLFSSIFELNLNEKTIDVALECEGADFSKMHSPRDSGLSELLIGSWVIADPDNTFLPELSLVTRLWMKMIRLHERVPRGETDEEFSAKLTPTRGYTSWYHRYNKISEQTLANDLSGITPEHSYGVFQIDDGYQSAVGDWLKMSPSFPNGVKPVFEEAKRKSLTCGIWCAPFIALEHSHLVKEHPEWVLKDRNGQPVVCGNHPLWGGLFFALNTENEDFKNHLREVLRTYFSDWGCTFLKADFLYAAARIPAEGLTRAQRAARAHQFLYDECRKYGAKLLSCGATLSSAYGRCEYSRVGPDVGETWENDEMGTATSREKVSTRATLVNTVSRALLDGVCFGNDPDVVILRDESQQMTREQRHLLATINAHLGRLVFCSDPVQDFSDWQKAEMQRIESTMRERKKLSLSATCGRVQNGQLYYQVILNSSAPSEGLQLQINLGDASCAGLHAHSVGLCELKESKSC